MRLQNNNNDPSVTFTLDLFTVSLLLSSLLFLFCLVLAKRKYDYLTRVNNGSRRLDTKKLLVLSAATASFLRIMSFVGVIAMDIANVRAHYTLKPATHQRREHEENSQQHENINNPHEKYQHPEDKNQSFYDSSMTVLFDLPNAIVISTYILLTLVWAECSLLSRFHTENSVHWRKKWLIWYMIFNTGLYATQLILYILIFVSGMESMQVVLVRNVVNVAMAGINFAAVFLVFCLYVYLNVSFSGFPYRSQSSKESLRKITNVMLFWSLTRIIWGVAMLVIYIKDVDLLSTKSGWEPFVLFLLLILCEIAPIIVLMDYSFMTIFEFERGATREMSSLASGRHVIEGTALEETGNEEEDVAFNVGDKSSIGLEEPLLGEITL
mmetsp:Transcript_14602/g.30612  ORF Transcript_14602/g.30612 Transcript_14602/m.30612 type:complete len:381 (-) Transcript_14602:755-1897(-)|eukprot:CAMPEP_0171339080 /NCGR_PEP_ID=MMETSP0878-20121228/7728_1 /TAXON_ID=67004 /ORGANISM="Thalassiosira weissflogii, Strain CCMP1336" /LENGTH=380 /DNA_ID=CAMNT_0011840941 /DNA_START=93 /DNA_END=1235 /DNA_ORIENTATION=-